MNVPTSQAAVRAAFWRDHAGLVVRRKGARGRTLHQNLQPADTRVAFVDYVDSLQRDGIISEALAFRVTL